MLSKILGDFIKNVEQLCVYQGVPLSQPVGFAQQFSEQGSARRILVRPLVGKPAGPNFYGTAQGSGGDALNQMVRKVWTTIEVQCWGLPDPGGDLLHNTDDTENLRQIVYVALEDTIECGYRATREVWDHGDAQSGLYGRCLSIFFEIEQPIVDIEPNYTTVVLTKVQLTAGMGNADSEETP